MISHRYLNRKLVNLIATLFGNKFSTGYALWYSKISAKYFYAYFKRTKHLKRINKFLAKYVLVYLNLPDFNWRFLDVFDAITPKYASTHTPEEVRSWFEKAGITKITQTDWAATSFIGQKK
jgi:hypothetical protein